MKIVFEDRDMIVCGKPAGLAVQSRGVGTMDLESMVRNHLAAEARGRVPYVGIINRIDQPVEGLVLMAKTREAAAVLTAQLQREEIGKEYLAVTETEVPPGTGALSDWLLKDGRSNRSMVVPEGTPGAKPARLEYAVPEPGAGVIYGDGRILAAAGTLVQIKLLTGRHHQIRVQMANAGMPLLGDRKYNAGGTDGYPLALCAWKLAFCHPKTGKRLQFLVLPEGKAFLCE